MVPPPEGVIRLVPLGGMGEVGKNLALLECGQDVVVIDAGLRFPEIEIQGTDVILPDISFLLTRKDRLRAVLLTHGHEDHIGALPFFLEQLGVPVYGTAVTLGLLRNKIRRRGRSGSPRLHLVQPGERVTAGAMAVEFLQVTHSVPGSSALAITTPAGLVVHTGDFKLDHTPVGSPPPDLARMGELGRQGVELLLSDSTNAANPGVTPSEATVRPALEAALRDSPGRVVVVTFASNLARIRQVLELAAAKGRRCCLVGRTMSANITTAIETGFLRPPEGGFLSPAQLSSVPDSEVCLLATGSQGEALAALSRIAAGTHPFVRPRSQDTVVLAANPIPGNEATINRVVNQLVDRGVEVISGSRDGVHASGHAASEELRFLLELIRPRVLAPVHGEPRHLEAHRRIAAEVGLSPEQVMVIRNGEVLETGSGGARVAGAVRAGAISVDADGVAQGGSSSRGTPPARPGEGAVLVAVTMDRRLRALVGTPETSVLGDSVPPWGWRVLKEGGEAVRLAVGARRAGFRHLEGVLDCVHDAMDSHLATGGSWRPRVVPVVSLSE